MAPYATLEELLTGRDLNAGPRLDLRRLPEGEEPRGYERFTVAPSTNLIGVEISDIDLREPVTSAVFADLDRALLEFKVLFFSRSAHHRRTACGIHEDVGRIGGPSFPPARRRAGDRAL